MTPRWAIKRIGKWAVEWGMAISGVGRLYRATSLFRRGCRILTYHRISEHPEDPHTVKTEHFRAHMKYLSEFCPVIGLSELAKRLTSGPAPEPGAVAVTFDDGYQEAAHVVSEILDHYRIPATFYVVTGVLDGSGTSVKGGPFVTWDDIRRMVSAGFSMGSHTVSHSSLGGMSLARVERELVASRNRITDETGAPPEGLSYPYGTVRDVSPAIAEMAKNAGYKHAVTAIHGLNDPGCNPFLLRRTTLTAGDGLRTFRMILKGHLDPWIFVDKWGYRLQRPRSGWM